MCDDERNESFSFLRDNQFIHVPSLCLGTQRSPKKKLSKTSRKRRRERSGDKSKKIICNRRSWFFLAMLLVSLGKPLFSRVHRCTQLQTATEKITRAIKIGPERRITCLSCVGCSRCARDFSFLWVKVRGRVTMATERLAWLLLGGLWWSILRHRVLFVFLESLDWPKITAESRQFSGVGGKFFGKSKKKVGTVTGKSGIN